MLRSLRYLGIFLTLCSGVYAQPETLTDQLVIWEENGQSDSVDFYYPKLLATYRSEDQLTDWLYSYWDWQAYWFDDTDRALGILDSALAQQWRPSQNAEESEALLWVHTNRAYHLTQFGQILAATRAYEAAFQLYQKNELDFFDAVDFLFLPLGAHYTRLGDNEKAQGIYLEALRIAKGEQDVESQAGIYNNLGLTYWNAGQYSEAGKNYLAGLKLLDLSALKTGLLHLSLAQSLFDRNAWQQAAENLQLAEEKLRSIQDSKAALDYLSGVLTIKGRLSGRNTQFRLAHAQLQEALRLARSVYGNAPNRDIGKIYVYQGELFTQQKDFPNAVQSFNKAISTVLPSFQPKGNHENPLASQLYEENTLMEALAGKANVYEQWGLQSQQDSLLFQALNCYELAAVVESKLRATFQYESSKISLQADSRRRTERALSIIEVLQEGTSQKELLESAFSLIESAKAEVLLEAMQENLSRNALRTKDSLLSQELQLKTQIAYFARQLVLNPGAAAEKEWQRQKFELEQELVAVESSLNQKHPRLASFRQLNDTTSWSSMQAILLPDTSAVFISYFVGEESVFALLLDQAGPQVFSRIGTVDEIGVLVQAFLGQFRERNAFDNLADYQSRASAIYAKILALLLVGYAPSELKMTISPDSWLGFLPFETLVVKPDNNVRQWSQVDFLLQKHHLYYCYSAQVALLQTSLQTQARHPALLVAPLFEESQRNLAPLPGSREELKAISLKCSDRKIGSEANLAATLEKISDYQILHFSTHAQADTSLQTASIEFFDQALYLPEIYALRLQADLVVLSACETGMGQVEKGEGVMSLARAFTYAGAGGLVSSLWPVNAQSTNQLMADFYRFLKAKQPAGTAINQAKKNYLDHPEISNLYKSPYYWAGFIYIGSSRSIDLQAAGRKCISSSLLVGGGVLLLLAALVYFFNKTLKETKPS